MTGLTIRKWVLARRPEGLPRAEDFRLEEAQLPEPGEGQVLLKTLALSVDPGMRTRLSKDSYGAALALGDVIDGFNLARVSASRHPKLAEGDLVTGGFGWASGFLSDGRGWMKLDPAVFSGPVRPTYAIGVLGVPGLTAYFGLLDLGRPQGGETLLVSSAAGPVGATAGQIAKAKGLKVVGIAGGEVKCGYVRGLGFDHAIDRQQTDDMAAAIHAAAPAGVDIYFDNVGGETLDAAIANLNLKGRIVVSGLLSEYNRAEPYGMRRTADFINKRLTMSGLVVFDYRKRFPEAMAEMAGWIREGRLSAREDLWQGFERLPEAFIGVLKGDNLGRRIVEV